MISIIALQNGDLFEMAKVQAYSSHTLHDYATSSLTFFSVRKDDSNQEF